MSLFILNVLNESNILIKVCDFLWLYNKLLWTYEPEVRGSCCFNVLMGQKFKHSVFHWNFLHTVPQGRSKGTKTMTSMGGKIGGVFPSSFLTLTEFRCIHWGLPTVTGPVWGNFHLTAYSIFFNSTKLSQLIKLSLFIWSCLQIE